MCGLFGFLDYKESISRRQKIKILKVMGKQSEERGVDAAGYAYLYNNAIQIHKRALPAHRMSFSIPFGANAVIGHTRMTTQGVAKDNWNNHPFQGKCGQTGFALAHNGVLYNDRQLCTTHKLPATKIQTDSYVAVQLLEQQKSLDLISLRTVAERVEGSFVFTVLDQQQNLYVVRGDNPIAMRHYVGLGLYLYASTKEILQQSVKRLHMHHLPFEEVDISMGEILKIDVAGTMERDSFRCAPAYGWNHWPQMDVDLPCPLTKRTQPQNDVLWELLEFAGNMGVSQQDVCLLYTYGYSMDEIEDLLYYPSVLQRCAEEIRFEEVLAW